MAHHLTELDLFLLGDHINRADLIGSIASALLPKLALRLGALWQEQNPGIRPPNAYAQLTVTVDYHLVGMLCAELAREAANAIDDLPLNVKAA